MGPRGTWGFLGNRELWGSSPRLFFSVSAPKLPNPEIHTPREFPLSFFSPTWGLQGQAWMGGELVSRSERGGAETWSALCRGSDGFREKSGKAASRSWAHSWGQEWGGHQSLGVPGAASFQNLPHYPPPTTCRLLPSPLLEVLMSESSRVPFWASR